MFSASENRGTSLGFGRFLAQLGSLILLGLVVWAGLYTAAVWNAAAPQPIAADAGVAHLAGSTKY